MHDSMSVCTFYYNKLNRRGQNHSGGRMRRNRKKDKASANQNQQFSYAGIKLQTSLDANVQLFQQIFNNDETLLVRFFENQQEPLIKCCVLYIDGMIDIDIVGEHVIHPIMENSELSITDDIIAGLQTHVIFSNHTERTPDVKKLTMAIVQGNTILFVEGAQDGLILSTEGWKSRPIMEPQSERVNRGPREGFTESIMTNLTLIRRRMKTPSLKMKFITMGVRTNTNVCICYIDGIVNQRILDELFRRLDRIHLDGILDSGIIKELIRDSPLSPLETVGDTERPDTAAGKLLEGHIALMVDGSPVVLILPYVFQEIFQVSEDYFINFYFASIGRILRILSFFITISVPAIYLALVTYHQEMIPTPLLLSISAARQGVPFPTIIEVGLLLVAFEILRETGVRMPFYIGQALSVVGALVLGTASVEAKIVSAPIVIVVSITAITGLSIPGIKSAVIILRVILLSLAAFLGLYGYLFGIMGLLLHLCEMRSFGVPYMLSFITLDASDLKDTAIRAPRWMLNFRPEFMTSNRLRQKLGGRKR